MIITNPAGTNDYLFIPWLCGDIRNLMNCIYKRLMQIFRHSLAE
jgi:hypothetical protein